MTEEEKIVEWIESARCLLERAKEEINESILLVSSDEEKWSHAYNLYCEINVFLENVWRFDE